jgi:uncharacterized protein (DUF1501 family)
VDTVTRRKFLLASGVAGAGAPAAGGGVLGWRELHRAAATATLEPGAGILVLLTMYGGNDGLNAVVPAADPVYQSSRPGLAYDESVVLDLGDGLGLNPSMTGMHRLWQEGRLAIVRGVGYPNADHSHFVSMDIWQTASPADPQASGWLGRWLDAQPDDESRALRAVSLGGTLPPLPAGTRTAGSALPLGRFRLPLGRFRLPRGATGTGAARTGPKFVPGLSIRRLRRTGHVRSVHRGGRVRQCAARSEGLVDQRDRAAARHCCLVHRIFCAHTGVRGQPRRIRHALGREGDPECLARPAE